MRRLVVVAWLLGCAHAASPGLVEAARTARRNGDRPAAFDAYVAAVCAAPQDLQLGRELVEAWDELGRPGRVTTSVERCGLSPVLAKYLDGLGRAAAGGLDGAAVALDAALASAQASDAPEVAYRRGLVALRLNDGATASAVLERAASQAPTRVDVRLAGAQSLVLLRRFSEVTPALSAILTLHPSADDLSRARAVLNGAVRASEPALAIDAAAAVRSLLSSLERSELTTAHLGDALQLVEATGGHPRALVTAGLVALRLNATSQAADLLGRAAAASPLDPDPLRALAVSFYASERVVEALPYLKGLALRDPFDIEAARMLAKAALERGDRELARVTYARLVALAPDVAEPALWLARLEHERGDLAAASVAVERGVALEPRDVPLLFERAAIDAELLQHADDDGRSAAKMRARAAIEALADVAPDHPGVEALRERVDGR